MTKSGTRSGGFRSGFERSIATQLTNAGVPFGYETLKVPYVLEGVYNPDFILGFILEAKGIFDAADRRKMLAVKKQHPELDIRMVFQCADNKIAKNSKTTYGDWCTKNGILWAEGRVPEEWLTHHL